MHEAIPLQNMQGHMSSSTLPEEMVEEILLRVPADEPVTMVRAALVCKAWRRILADDGFLRRYRRFHGTPPLLGFIYDDCLDSTVKFVPTTCIAASTISMPTYDTNGCVRLVLDCRHGRVLIQPKQRSSLVDRLIVWDPITGDRHQLRVPTYPYSAYKYSHAGAVLCAKDACDHLNCHGGSFLVVWVATCHDNNGVHTCASVYSSETGAWRAWTHNNDITNHYIHDNRPSLLIGDALYFPTSFPAYGIVKYDFFKHELSVMELPRKGCPVLIKGDNGDLGAATILRNCIYMWSWKANIKGVGEWVKYRAMELEDTLFPSGIQPRNLICMAEGTNTVFIGIEGTGKFMLDLKSKHVRKIVEGKSYFYENVLPYMSFYTPKC